MTSPKLEPGFARALRAALVGHVTSSRSRSRRFFLTTGAVIAVGVVGGGAAVANDLLPPLPGGNLDTALNSPVTSIEIGPALIALTDVPAGTTHVEIAITCLAPGRITYPDGAAVVCTTAEESELPTSMWTLPVAPGQQVLVVNAAPDLEWGLATTFVHRVETEWGINANGDSYGVIKDGSHHDDFMPDLVAVIAANGETGYAYAEEIDGPVPSSPEEALEWQEEQAGQTRTVPVYLSDGETVIGEFVIG